jgi:hypothetical protein
MPEILPVFVNPRWRLSAAILDRVQRSKLIRNIFSAQLRRSAKFGRNGSRHAGDITGFSKSKMALRRHLGLSSKVTNDPKYIYDQNVMTF